MVSVLFCDLVGFTAASEHEDPEDVRARMQGYYQHLRREIERFGGTVEKYIGDAVMAVFGAPLAHEDDPERAVRAGLAMMQAIGELNDADPALALAARVGINTGEVLVSLGASSVGEGELLGDAVNTAARIQSASPVNGVAVGESTFKATERVFEYERLDPISAKGKSEPVQVFRALAPRARLGSDVIRSMMSPLVGRDLDLTLLRGSFDKVVAERSPQLVTVLGEPGVGKSRLVAELLTYIDSLPELVTWRQGRCLPYGEGIAFWALGEIVKAHAGIFESDSPDVATGKLEAVLPDSDERPWLRARLLPLLGMDAGEAAAQAELFTAWRKFLEAVAEQGPMVMVVEDIHWADPPMLAFLEHLADWAQGERAGGNPLYAEEFVRMLRDRDFLNEHGSLRSDMEVPFPESIQALIAARLDTLPHERKSLLQDAAVMGKVFWAGSPAAMGDREPREVEQALHELARKELVRPSRQSSMESEAEYGFWHLLVRDVAYAQIPRAQRVAKHLNAASWLEGKAGERVEDLAEVLAYHTGEALTLAQATGDPGLQAEISPAAARYALLAGERALGLDTGKALTLLERARALTPDQDPAFPLVLLRWADAARQAGRLPEAAQVLEQAAASFEAEGDVLHAGEALTLLSDTRLRLGEPGHMATAERAVVMLEPMPGPELVASLTWLAGAHYLIADYSAAIVTVGRALTLADQLGLPVPGRARGYRGGARSFQGDLGGLTDIEQALDLLIADGKGRDAAQLQHILTYTRWFLEGPAAAATQFEQARAFAAGRGLAERAQASAASSVAALIACGRLDEAVERAETLLPLLRVVSTDRRTV